jgi:hypothetical protein
MREVENTANVGMFAVHKIISDCAERIWRRRKDNNGLHEIFFTRTLYTRWVGLSEKTISRYCPFNSHLHIKHRAEREVSLYNINK